MVTGHSLERSLQHIRSKSLPDARIGLILGSGLGDLAESLEEQVPFDTRAIPGYPHSTIEGHKGRIVFGTHAGIPVVAWQGRVHFYETGDVETPLFPIRVAHGLGIRILIITNAAGGINPAFSAGELMLITDQINLTGEHIPLVGQEVPGRKPVFDKELIRLAEKVSRDRNVHLWRGVYAGVKGPSYETAAEVQMIGRLGGDAVGMSTVLETSLASALGMRVAGISCITNKATGTGTEKLSHDEVKEAALTARKAFATLLFGMVEEAGGLT